MDEYDLSEVLAEFALTLVTDYSITAILDHLVARMVDVLPVTSAGVTLIAPGVAPWYVAASDDDALQYEILQSKLVEGPSVEAFASGQPVVVDDLVHDPRFPAFGPAAVAAGLAAVVTFPLHHGTWRFGALDLYRSVPGGLDPEAMRAAQTLAGVVSAYLINAQSREGTAARTREMRHMSTHDALTGLPNLLLLRQRLARIARRPRDADAPAAVLFIDVDDFKQVNDTYGHQVGDQVLREVAERLGRLVRRGDTLARIYGDEFVLLCEDLTGREDLDALAQHVGSAFEQPFVVGNSMFAVSASVGVAFSGTGAQVCNDLVKQADRAMYEVKRERRTGRST